jgi:CRP/FNR family transcriptional regulator, dissimilatory nitrate respiration regulator
MSRLLQCPLFHGIPTNEVEMLLDNKHAITKYPKGALVALQSVRYDSLLIVSEGKVRGEMMDVLGRTTLIEEISAPRAVAPAFLFASENKLPVAILADEESEIVSIHRSHFTEMMQKDARLLTNFLKSISDRSRFLSDKLRMQRFGTIRSKLVQYLLEISKRELGATRFIIPHTQQQLADRFGVTRPALARGIANLEEEGLIRSKGKQFELLDIKNLLKD